MSDVEWTDDGQFWFDEAAANFAVSFFPRYLRHTEGEWAGQPFVLAPWQEHDIIRPLFGWKRPDGTRRYRRGFVWIARKNGKSELGAGIGLLQLIGDGEPGAQVFSIANDKQQAEIVFNKAALMVGLSEELSRHLTSFKTSIWCPELQGSYRALSGRPRGKHGLSMSGLVADEIHEWVDGDLYTYVRQSSGARRQPLEFLISTAGKRGTFGWDLYQHCLKIAAGDVLEPETLVVIYAANPEDDWRSDKALRDANPNLGVSPKLEFLEAERRKAMASPRAENDFKRYHLNLWTEQLVRWLSLGSWDECGHEAPALPAPALAGDSSAPASPVIKRPAENARWMRFEEELQGRRCCGGIDLSATADLTAWVMVFPPEDEQGRWVLLPRFFVPAQTIARRSRDEGVKYEQWAAMGALIATPGNVTDYGRLKAQVFADAERFLVGKIGIDRWNATQLSTELIDEGLDVVLFGQGFASMSAPAKELERLMLSGRLDHGGHPVLRWCAGNVAVDTDAAGNIKPAKDKSSERIDGIVGAIEGLGVALAGGADGPSVYATRGIITVRV